MEVYGIKNLQENVLNFEYDKYYRKISLELKEIKDEEKLCKARENFRKKLSEELSFEIDYKILKENFINILKDENSAKYLWIFYSKYDNEENYIDKISQILKEENRIYRAGINLYKLNGWMTHSLYVYQIANYNVAKNIPLSNFDGDSKKKEYINELYEIYKKLSNTGKFMLKVISLVHDIGVIEDVAYHDKIGYKYVDKVLTQIGITNENLKEYDISYSDLKGFIEEVIRYHTIMALLSGENSDKCVENHLKQMLKSMPNHKVKNEIAKIMYIFTFADVIAVNETLLDEEKFQRLKNCYIFFEEIMEGKLHNRDKTKVALDRICDMCKKSYEEVSASIDSILAKLEIDKEQFIEDMYNVKWFHYTGPLMKTVNNLEVSIKVFYVLTDLIKELDSKEALKDYIITFVPDKPSIEYEFIEAFNNGQFFKCAEIAKTQKKYVAIYEKVKIEKKEDKFGKHLNISILE